MAKLAAARKKANLGIKFIENLVFIATAPSTMMLNDVSLLKVKNGSDDQVMLKKPHPIKAIRNHISGPFRCNLLKPFRKMMKIDIRPKDKYARTFSILPCEVDCTNSSIGLLKLSMRE